MSSHDPLTQLRHLDASSPTFQDQVSNVLYGEEYKQWMPNLQDDGLMGLVDYLDKALDVLDPGSSAFRKCLRELKNICGSKTILPTSYTVSSQPLHVNPQPVTSGGSADVYEGTLNGSKVCIKRVRVYSQNWAGSAKTFYQEAVVWKRLEHQNIVPFLGITTTPFQLILEWMSGGVLTKHVREHPDADRHGLLSDVVGGLYYLHSRNVVHGDLKGSNILVDATGHARITDFGLATVTRNLDSLPSAPGGCGNAARWTAPEILTGDEKFSKEADIFSFAMVMIEGFTGVVPFNDRVPAAAIVAIMKGERPPRPTHPSFTEKLWTLMQRCWHQDPHSRPEVLEVFKALHGSTPPPIPQGFQVDDSDPTGNRDGGQGRENQGVSEDTPEARLTGAQDSQQQVGGSSNGRRNLVEEAGKAKGDEGIARRLKEAREPSERPEREDRQREVGREKEEADKAAGEAKNARAKVPQSQATPRPQPSKPKKKWYRFWRRRSVDR